MNIRNTLLVAFVMIISFSNATAQSAPSQPEHEKVVYVSGSGDYYVQKSLPVYLHFSTSPDGKSYTLKSKTTGKYTNPMYLDTEGVNYIRSKWAVDPATMKTVQPMREVLYEMYCDGVAPRTSRKFSGAPIYIRGGVTYYGKGLQLTLTSTDAVSKVAKTHVALDATTYSDYSSPISIDGEGSHNVYYYAHDNVGNAEAQKNNAFTVDITAPVSSHDIVGIVHNSNIIAPSTKFKLSNTDNLSGVRITHYNYDNGTKRTYSSYPVGVSGLADGEHTINYWATDNVKNEEAQKTFSFYLDKIAPVVTHTIVGDQHKSNCMWVSSRTTIKYDATDNKAGVKSITYSIDNGSKSTYSSPISVPTRDGTHYIRNFGTDNVENKSTSKTLTVCMDNTKPKTHITYSTPQFFTRDTLFITKNTPIKLHPRDGGSGIKKTEYAIDGGSMTNYSEFNVEPEGFHTISWKSTDNVNNVEDTKESKCFVDNTPPVIHHNFSIEPIGTKGDKKIYPNYTRLYLGATDKKVGTASIKYSMDGGKTYAAYSSPQTLDISELNRFLKRNVSYKVHVIAKDKLGNESEKTIEFHVEK